MTQSGAPFMKNAVRKPDFPLTLTTAGSGLTAKNLKKRDWRHSLAAALTRVLHRLTAPMPKSMNLTQLIPLIFWTATAATTAMPLPRTSTRKSTCVRFPLRAAILKTANGLKFLRWALSVNITLTVSVKRICICYTTRNWNLSPSIFRKSKESASLWHLDKATWPIWNALKMWVCFQPLRSILKGMKSCRLNF